MNIEKLKQKIGQLAIVELAKSISKTVWYTIEIVQCTECHRKYPAFNFEILYMWPNPEDPKDNGVCYCRKCFNDIVAGGQENRDLAADYYQHFNPISDLISHFEWNGKSEVQSTLEDLNYRKIRKHQVNRHD